MSLISNLWSSLFPSLEGDHSQRAREREIDASTRFALLGAVKASVFWMALASALGLICSVKLHTPSYLADLSFLTYGKVYPAFWNVLVYGWLCNAGLACVAWILVRLSGRPAGNSGLLTIALVAWNVAIVVGVAGIFLGFQNPHRLLEFPVAAAPFLFAAFGAIGIWILLTFKARVYRSAFASQWYALAAVFSFVWVYTIAQVMLFCSPAQGVFQGVVAAWYFGNVFGLVVAPLALATLYYLIPKALGQHIVGYRQSGLAFWSWLAFSSCSGLASLANGPFPAWLATVGVVASFGLFLPVTIFSMQFLSSLFASFSKIWDTISMRYAFYAVVAFLVSTLLIIFGSLRNVQEVVQFSQFDSGSRYLFLVGFAGMAFTGGIYFLLPRLLHKELPSAGLADVQFWMQGLGTFAVTLSLVLGGWTHGSLLNGSSVDTAAITYATRSYHFIGTLGSFLFLCGSLAYAVSFVWMLLAPRAPKEASTGLLPTAPELKFTAQ